MNILILFGEKKLFDRRVKHAYLHMDDVFCDVIIVPYSADEIENMKERKFNAVYRQIYPACKYSLVFSALPARLAARLRADSAQLTDGSEINIKYIKEIIMRAGSYSSSVGIYCERITPRVLPLIYRLCEITALLHIFTRDTESSVIDEISEYALSTSGTPVRFCCNMSEIRGIDILVAYDAVDFEIPPRMRMIDIREKNRRGIYGLMFSVPEKYAEIQMLCGADTDSRYAEFLYSLGADFSEIKIKSLREH